ncbi:MAG: hypothetical protein JETT_2535 [Candidatus Jettenia ecosi]|uniref:Uncharacterized protein n=1 Tax=Candidatus Jettenia ecosi TaxID=2494326 RepID=A0A533Q931_9BACT|nr:MAG: hypothetical protein JETT_2535 [Candidatus Jettenia ecosi]
MIKKIPYILVMIFVFPPFTFSETFCNISPNLKLSIKNYLRFSGNSIGNNLDLDNKKSEGVTYVGYTYDTEFNIIYFYNKDGLERDWTWIINICYFKEDVIIEVE